MLQDPKKEKLFGVMKTDWIHTIEGKLTFCGALSKYFEECAENWNADTTLSQYGRDYDTILLPALVDHDRKPISEYTKEDFDAAILTLRQGDTDNQAHFYSKYPDKRLHHFEFLYRIVMCKASNHNECSDVLWGTRYRAEENVNLAQDKRKEYTRLKKSFTPEEDQKIAKEIMLDPYQRGQLMALAAMYSAGTRNGEACAITYGDIRAFPAQEGAYVLWVYKSSEGDTVRIKGSGKTKNADRIVPLPDLFVQLVHSRMQWIKERTGLDNVDRLPLACVDESFDTPCTPSQVTAAARTLFHDVDLQEGQLQYIDQALEEKRLADTLGEKEATAYLMRRNFATHLYLLGLEEHEIQYVLGHEIENAYFTRNEFVNDEQLARICKKMRMRPLVNNTKDAHIVTCKPQTTYSLEGTNHTLRIKNGEVVRMSVSAREPGEKIKIRYTVRSERGGIQRKIYTKIKDQDYGRTLDIKKAYHSRYRNK